MQYSGFAVVACVFALSLHTFAARNSVVEYKYEVVETYPHDGTSFTQGLFCDPSSSGCSVLYESTGLHGHSVVRRVKTKTGEVIAEEKLPANLFGEGLTLHNGALYQTTWREHEMRRYDPVTLELTGSSWYNVETEGWGLTSDGVNIIESCGSSTIRFFTVDDDLNQHVKRSVEVKLNGRSLSNLNELEYINGHIWANVWFSDRIYEIDPENGNVIGMVDLSDLHSVSKSGAGQHDVLNGIAYDADANEFLVTGKNWHAIHRIRLVNPKSDAKSEL